MRMFAMLPVPRTEVPLATQVNVPMGSFCTLDGKRLQLLQWHFHTPSEHAFDGNREAMEIHLVHRDINSGG